MSGKSFIQRRHTRQVHKGSVIIGGGAPVSVQSMTNTKTTDPQATSAQIKRLAEAGCEIVRVAVPDEASASAVKEICAGSPLPVVADIHFNHLLAVKSIENGVCCARLNPGNVFRKNQIQDVIACAKAHGASIRIGANSGSIRKGYGKKYADLPLHEAMVNSVIDYLEIFEKASFNQIVISLKGSTVLETIAAYRLMAQKVDYPLHVGITSAGSGLEGVVASSAGIGSLLIDGIGDTIRFSLTGDPVQEVLAARALLQSLELRSFGPQVVSCPTCARTHADLEKLVDDVKNELAKRRVTAPVKIAVMGCEVNGPGEARDADLGIAFGENCAVIFKNGKLVEKISLDRLDKFFEYLPRG